MQDSTLSDAMGFDLIFEDELHPCEREGVNLSKDASIYFVLTETFILYFY